MVTARGDNEGIGRIAAAEGETALLVALGAEGEEDAVVRGAELGAEGDGEGLGIGGQRRLHIAPGTLVDAEVHRLILALAGHGDVMRGGAPGSKREGAGAVKRVERPREVGIVGQSLRTRGVGGKAEDIPLRGDGGGLLRRQLYAVPRGDGIDSAGTAGLGTPKTAVARAELELGLDEVGGGGGLIGRRQNIIDIKAHDALARGIGGTVGEHAGEPVIVRQFNPGLIGVDVVRPLIGIAIGIVTILHNELAGHVRAAEGHAAQRLSIRRRALFASEGKEKSVCSGTKLGAEGNGKLRGARRQDRLRTPRSSSATKVHRLLSSGLAGHGTIGRGTDCEGAGALLGGQVAIDIAGVGQCLLLRKGRLGAPGIAAARAATIKKNLRNISCPFSMRLKREEWK